MARKRYATEEIIRKLREADVLIGQAKRWPMLFGILGCQMSPTTAGARVKRVSNRMRCDCPRNGGLKVDQAKRFKELEKENARLKHLLADAELDKSILREAASGNF